jgi:hypothetical protein
MQYPPARQRPDIVVGSRRHICMRARSSETASIGVILNMDSFNSMDRGLPGTIEYFEEPYSKSPELQQTCETIDHDLATQL